MAEADVIKISEPTRVNMGSAWYEIASLEHFWIRRRFDALMKLLRGGLEKAYEYCEVGCGTGLLRRQLYDRYGIACDGIDLNLEALVRNDSPGQLYFYDIFEKRPEFAARYHAIFLFDVIEHIEDAPGFVAATGHMLKPGGKVIINVPAMPSQFCDYDRAVGHIRRYDAKSLGEELRAAGFSMGRYSYWGAPYIPLLVARKRLHRNLSSEGEVISKGLYPRGALGNSALYLLGAFEPLPQRLIGISLLAIATRDDAS